jgi:glycine reductase
MPLDSKDHPVELQLLDYTLEDIQWSERTTLNGKTLFVSVADLQEQIKDLSRGVHIDYEIARPGESKRIVHVLDTVLPIAKLNSSGSTFPGLRVRHSSSAPDKRPS